MTCSWDVALEITFYICDVEQNYVDPLIYLLIILLPTWHLLLVLNFEMHTFYSWWAGPWWGSCNEVSTHWNAKAQLMLRAAVIFLFFNVVDPTCLLASFLIWKAFRKGFLFQLQLSWNWYETKVVHWNDPMSLPNFNTHSDCCWQTNYLAGFQHGMIFKYQFLGKIGHCCFILLDANPHLGNNFTINHLISEHFQQFLSLFQISICNFCMRMS